MVIVRQCCCIVLLFSFSLPAVADWKLETQESAITWLSNKILTGNYLAIYEKNSFKAFTGSLKDSGQASVVIDMSSIDTKIPIRNERIMEHVFKVSEYPQAHISLNVVEQVSLLDRLPLNHVQIHDIQADLSMVGITRKISGKITVTRFAEGKLLVQTVEPILVDVQVYDMGSGFEVLKNIAKLFNIPTTIPVSFTLVFTRL